MAARPKCATQLEEYAQTIKVRQVAALSCVLLMWYGVCSASYVLRARGAGGHREVVIVYVYVPAQTENS